MSLRSVTARVRALPAWGEALVIYAISRVVSTAMLGTVFILASTSGWPFASKRKDPTFFTFLGSWDASWYRKIADMGYPTSLPLDAKGEVLSNAWAFLPVFPYLSKGLASLTGMSFFASGVVIATASGAAAAILLYRLILLRAPRLQARWGTIFFCFAPLSFILQVAYAESLVLALTFGALIALMKRQYALMTLLAVISAFTRPGALALALALGIHLVVRWVGSEPFPWRERWTIAVSGIIISAAGLSWPLVASAATGRPSAYLETELAWWVPLIGRVEFVPLTPWFALAQRWMGVAGIVAVLAIVAGAIWWMTRPHVKELGHEIVAYSASYALYLFAVFLPQQSTYRLLMPLSPLLGDRVFSATAARRWGLLCGCVVLQAAAIIFLWFLSFP